MTLAEPLTVEWHVNMAQNWTDPDTTCSWRGCQLGFEKLFFVDLLDDSLVVSKISQIFPCFVHVIDIILHTHVASSIPNWLISTFLDHHIQLNLSTMSVHIAWTLILSSGNLTLPLANHMEISSFNGSISKNSTRVGPKMCAPNPNGLLLSLTKSPCLGPRLYTKPEHSVDYIFHAQCPIISHYMVDFIPQCTVFFNVLERIGGLAKCWWFNIATS